MSDQAIVADLRKKAAALKKIRDSVIKKLEADFSEVFDWLKENGIDLNDLRPYAKQIAATFFVTFALLSINFDSSLSLQVETAKRFATITQQDLSHLSLEDRKAVRVWDEYGDIIIEMGVQYKVDPKVIFATIMVESMGNPKASRYEPHLGESSYGLGQILYSTAKWIGYNGSAEGLYDPRTNIELIARYHARNNAVYGDLSPQELATAYNAGSPYAKPLPGHISKFMKWYNYE